MRILRFVPAVRRYMAVGENERARWGWGFAYEDYSRYGYYAAPIPLNWLIFAGWWLWSRVLINPARACKVCPRCGHAKGRRDPF